MTKSFSSALRSSWVSPLWASMYSSSQWEGVNRVVAIFLPRRSSMERMVFRETMPSPPRDQSCIRIALAFSPDSARIEASRAQESTVSHMTSMSPLRNAASLAAGSSSSTNLTSRP